MIYYQPIQLLPWQLGSISYGQAAWNPWLPFQQPFYAAGRNPSAFSQTAGNAAVRAEPARAAQAAGKQRRRLKPEQFTARGLEQKTLDQIISKYGTEIEDIYRLSPGQKWMFGRAQTVTNAFFLQTFFKVTMALEPAAFRQKLDEVSLKRPNLRTAIAYQGLAEPYQVVLKNRRPELRFIDRSDRTLEELREELAEFRVADRRRGFDLENDPLLRITIFSTAEKDTYAIISSQPHINDDGESEVIVFKEIFVDYALGGRFPLPELAKGSYRKYAEWLEGLDRESECRYWENLLSGAPETRLPGRIPSALEPEMNTLLLTFSPEENRVISKLQARYGATLNSIVQAAWAVMLQKIYHTRDVVFGSITSGRSANVKDSSLITGGFVNAFPVRVQAGREETFAEVVKRVQLQILQSQEKAHFSPDELGERLGRTGPVFDHLLNFHNFAGGLQRTSPSLPGFTLLDVDTYDNLSTGFSLYFQLREGALHCLFTFDRHSFTERKIRQLMRCYRQVLQQILADESKDLSIGRIQCPDIASFLRAERDDVEELERVQSFLKTVPLFEGIPEAGLLSLAREAVIHYYSESDEILREGSEPKGLDIVMRGLVESFRTAKNGWASPLMILRPGKPLAAAGVLAHVPSYTGASASSAEVSILHIPRESAIRFFESYPRAALNLVREQNELAQRLSFVWINADQ